MKFKIKKNKDLAELEKFGFKKEGTYYVYIEDEPIKNWCKHTINNLIGVAINNDLVGVLNPIDICSREIVFSSYSFEGYNAIKTLSKFYELTKSGLVEKVEK